MAALGATESLIQMSQIMLQPWLSLVSKIRSCRRCWRHPPSRSLADAKIPFGRNQSLTKLQFVQFQQLQLQLQVLRLVVP